MEFSRSLRGFVEKLEDVTGFQFKLVDSHSSARFFQIYCGDGSEVDVFDEDSDRVLLVLEDARGTREYKIRKSSLAIADTIVSKFVKEHGGSEWEQPSRRAVEIEKRKGYWTESRKSRRKMLGESLTYYISVPNEEYPHEFHSAIEAKRFMKQHPGSTGEKVRVRSNGEWEPCGEIVLKGRNSVKMSDRNSYAYESRRRPGRLIKESTENLIKNVFWEVLDIGVNGEDDWEKVEEKEDEDDKTYTSVYQLLDKFERYGEPEDIVVRRGANIGREIDVDEIDDVLNKPEQYEINLFIPKGKNREYRVNLFFDVVPTSMICKNR